eukprot:TRINITY_DN25964_c0_g1_i1.p1 TRINITY_DN25964_c0_g1~~TRINITY_DN25964_c0_g1_i1.p1  ORF type:complete len:159 (-),score=8.51 TRINITY_DN25964_c0_g1_i1:75-551(-)
MPAQLFATTGARAYGSTGKSLVQSQQVMDGLMQRIRENNLVSAADLDKRFVPFKVDGEVFGYLKPDFAAVLEEFSDTFVVNADSVQFAPAYADASVGSKARTDAVARVTNSLRERGVITGSLAFSSKLWFQAKSPLCFPCCLVYVFGLCWWGWKIEKQ